jgi:hypothetical protein
MPSLQEILAKKKAEAAQAAAVVPADSLAQVKKIEVSPTDNGTVITTKTDVKDQVAFETKTVAEPVKKEEPAVAAPKALTFAEKMALKKKQDELAKAYTPPVQDVKQSAETPAPIPVSAATTVATVQQKPDSKDETLRTGVMDARLDKNPMPLPDRPAPEDTVDPQTAQAYADIKDKIDKLNMLADTDLGNAMKDLKKALMANPAAVALMEDSDIGQMVIALRKITGEAIQEASKEKKPGRKKSANVDLTNPEVVAGIFEEL